MAGFSTIALIGLGLAGAAGAAAIYDAKKDRSGGRTNPAATVGTTNEIPKGARPIPPGAEIVGQAMLRSDAKKQNTTPDPPPSTSALASANTTSAYAAGERARKRAAAGGSVLTGAQKGMAGPSGSFNAKTLVGS